MAQVRGKTGVDRTSDVGVGRGNSGVGSAPGPPERRYRTIVADPPWEMPGGGPQTGTTRWANADKPPSALPYDTLALDAIKALPVGELAGAHAHLYLWVPNAFLEASFDVVRAWGFKPSQTLVWCKAPRGLGPGGAYANTTEYILFARRGSLRPLGRQNTTWWNFKRPFVGSRIAHSRKPDGFLDVVEQVSPGPYVELFARRDRLGWDTWGAQALGTAELPKRAA